MTTFTSCCCCPTVISLFFIPTNENTSTIVESGSHFNSNFPLTSVATPVNVPFTNTVTPGNGIPLLSFTVPLINRFSCAAVFSPFARIRITLLKSSYSKFTFPNTIFNTRSNSMSFTFTETVPASRTSAELYMKRTVVWFLTASTNCSTDTPAKSKVTRLCCE